MPHALGHVGHTGAEISAERLGNQFHADVALLKQAS
jgi:hypothetical protein